MDGTVRDTALAMIRVLVRASSCAVLLLALVRCTAANDAASGAAPPEAEDEDASAEDDAATTGARDASKDATKDAANPKLDADTGDATLPFCPAGRPDECLSDAGAKLCVDLNDDPENCGACGAKCGASQGCVAKQCKDKITLAAVASKLVSGSDDCTMLASNAGRLVAIDAVNTIYVAMRCKDSLHVIRSTDGGATFSAPVSTGIGPQSGAIDAESSSIAVADDGALYAVGSTTSNTLYFTKSVDGGATWATPTQIQTAQITGWGAHVTANGAEVIIGSRESGVVWIHRNLARGTGTWTMSPTGLQGVFGDVRVDRGTGDIWAMADDPNVKFEKYARGQLSVKGVSNATKINPFATHYCSTYALANGKIFISGSNNNFSAGEADRFAYLDLAAAPTAGAPTAGVNVFVATGSPSTGTS